MVGIELLGQLKNSIPECDGKVSILSLTWRWMQWWWPRTLIYTVDGDDLNYCWTQNQILVRGCSQQRAMESPTIAAFTRWNFWPPPLYLDNLCGMRWCSWEIETDDIIRKSPPSFHKCIFFSFIKNLFWNLNEAKIMIDIYSQCTTLPMVPAAKKTSRSDHNFILMLIIVITIIIFELIIMLF